MQRIPAEYLVPPADRAETTRPLPELYYPARLNLFEELVARHVQAGRGGAIAYFTPGGPVTYRELHERALSISAALLKLHIAPGDRVLLRMEDSAAMVATLLAIWRIGAVAAPTFVKFRSGDLAYRERDTAARAIVVSGSLVDEVAKAEAQFTTLEHVIVDGETSHPGYLDLAELERTAGRPADVEPTLAADVALILYTSGSTGEPKGCYHTHAEVLSVPDAYGNYALHTRQNDVFGGPPPLGFALGFFYHVLIPLRAGAAAVIGIPKTPTSYLEAIERYRITVMFGVPTFYNQLLNAAESSDLAWPGQSVRCAKSGGEPLRPSVFDRWNRWTGVALSNLIGFTEVLHHCISYREDVGWERSTALGRPLPSWEVVLRDPDTFDEVPRGEPGMLTVRGPTSTTYWRKPEAQHAVVRHGWNCFRDKAIMDDRGFLRFQSRDDDIIVASGYNISPSEVENILVGSPDVKECAAVSAPDPEGLRSAVVKAYVVPTPGTERSAQQVARLQEYFKQHGAPHMYPRVIEFVDALPLTSSGKLNRSALRRESNAGH